jgi:cation-transporting ATPase 13A3/4/5
MLDDEVLKSATWEPRQHVLWRRALYWALCVVTAGTVWIISTWSFLTRRRALWLSRPCRHSEADFYVITGADGTIEVPEVEAQAEMPLELLSWRQGRQRRRESSPIPPERRMVVYRHTRFAFNPHTASFRQLDPEEHTTPGTVDRAAGLSGRVAADRLALFGRNVIEIPIPPWFTLLLRECVHPFVIFQVWAVVVWLTEAYWSFSAFIFVSAIATAFMNFWEVRRNLREIRSLSLYTRPVSVIRGGSAVTVDSAALVPGDLLVIENDMKLPCDCVLVRGQCTVNEAMLTGESTVVVKQALPAHVSLNAADPKHTLFGGSFVAQLRVVPGQRVLGAVVRTGFDSVKGRLVLSILYPRLPPFKFLEQSLMFVGFLFALAMVGFGVNAKALADAGTGVDKIIQRGCDMVTIVVPPALPLALTVGIAYALIALRRDRIVCISPPRVNLAGKVNCLCFDKTGTLTTEGLEFTCIKPAAAGAVPDDAHDGRERPGFEDAEVTRAEALRPQLRALLACCHSLTFVKHALAGDPLELQTFAFSGATVQEPHTSGAADDFSPSASSAEGGPSEGAGALAGAHEVMCMVQVPLQASRGPARAHRGGGGGLAMLHQIDAMVEAAASTSSAGLTAELSVLQQFEFVPALQRMGVLVRAEGNSSGSSSASAVPPPLISFVKGAPEMIHSLCDPSTLPSDFFTQLRDYTGRGLRVLAAAARLLPLAALQEASAHGGSLDALRATAESGLGFLGFIVLENRLKPESAPTIARLQADGGIPCIMITGDNAVSAVCVARNCGIVPRGSRVFIGDLAPSAPSPAASPVAASPVTAWAPGTGAPRAGSEGADGTPRPEPASLSRGSSSAEGGVASICWSDVDDEGSTLDPATLLPARGGSAAGGGSPYILAITGRAYSHLLNLARWGEVAPSYLHRLVLQCRVFARMSPENKASVVEQLQGTGLYVCMVGDGANDSLALRAAHVGISLSQAEASVSAPFTSLQPNIACVLRVLCEGRGALATSFCLFQFMALYSTIQFCNALLIVFRQSFLSNNEYLYQDLFVVFILALTMGSTPSATKLTRKRPSANLLSLYNLTLSCGFILLTFAFQAWAFGKVREQPWYDTPEYPVAMDPEQDEEGTNSVIPETTTVSEAVRAGACDRM